MKCTRCKLECQKLIYGKCCNCYFEETSLRPQEICNLCIDRSSSNLSAALRGIPRPTEEELEEAERERRISDLPPVKADMCKCGTILQYPGGPCNKCNPELYEEYLRTGKKISRD